RIAYLAYGADPPVTPDQRAATGVRVVDGSGSEIAWFPSCYAPCWSRDCPRAAEAGVRTVVIDPRTMEILHELPGKLVTPTNDHRSVVLLRGDTLALADLPTWVREPARPLIGRIRMQIYAWGSGALG